MLNLKRLWFHYWIMGVGLSFHGRLGATRNSFSGFEIRFLDVKNDGEIPVTNYYTGQTYNIGDDALIMFPAFAKIRIYPLRGR